MTETSSRVDVLAVLLQERHSCRGFQPQPVPRATIDNVLATAAPT